MGIWGLIFQTFFKLFYLGRLGFGLPSVSNFSGFLGCGAASGLFKPFFWRKTGRKWPINDPHDASPKAPRRPDVASVMAL